ncbi:hypothetical protein [Mesorhizobium sp.]|uniref:hypothetical protein n=1 Tax=Mesorhizobium sp. TaxID=1871066 RepID=UPI000FD22BAA|nr:hypothetical protein [Mesorhizobium sp.]RVC47465.1 hypothetical protein EN779_31405 [Mesorhizobium sp. M4B.F.Ca.ET.088.02.2.1]RWA59874.1 MAG: hypothetical protein EOQ27_23925 [Mesorhizobium sp.]RWF32776.1 MAG: hypothetical protein EOS45_05120 [Mesorhizobium sp.]TIX14781.1 MAG: hypothetical protein E5V41_17750 [Mesorhizobium sp.]TJW04102.1 MAG: hypothetical protein E5W97_14425 [Mesorhizobium sp.]
MSIARLSLLAASLCATAVQALADGQDGYVFCDNGLRCIAAPCPSNSALELATGEIIRGVVIDIDGLPQEDKALDLQEKLYAGTIVIAGSIETRTQTFYGKRQIVRTLVATGIERAARPSERRHCSSR